MYIQSCILKSALHSSDCMGYNDVFYFDFRNEVQISSGAFCACAHRVHRRMHEYEDLYTTHVEDMQDTIETHSKSQEDCTKFSSDDLQNLSRNNWLIMNDKVNNNPLTL